MLYGRIYLKLLYMERIFCLKINNAKKHFIETVMKLANKVYTNVFIGG